MGLVGFDGRGGKAGKRKRMDKERQLGVRFRIIVILMDEKRRFPRENWRSDCRAG